MSWVVNIVLVLEVLLLLYIAAADIAARLIRNEACLALALLGIVSQLNDPSQVAQSLVVAAMLFALLLLIYAHGLMGGGDVKLLVAVAIGLPVLSVFELLTITALAGGILAMVHLVMRLLPSPSLAPAESTLLRRVYAVERWRHLRHAPLPYGVAIACGGIWCVLSKGS
jgi:Flp pilus assembly protein protease CpaA